MRPWTGEIAPIIRRVNDGETRPTDNASLRRSDPSGTTAPVPPLLPVVPPSPGPSERSANMRAIRRRDTKPELRVRSLLHLAGLRFRVDLPVRVEGYPRPIRPDVAFTRARLAVFWDGCYWHGDPTPGCPDAPRQNIRNGHYWLPKIAANRERDIRQTAALEQAGWRVLRFWGHEHPEAAAERIRTALGC